MNKQKKPLLYYYGIVLIVTILLNTILMPKIMNHQVQNVSYDEFLTMLEADEIKEVTLEEDELYFSAEKDGKTAYYLTGNWGDENLSDKLYEKNVRHSKILPQKTGFIGNLLLMILSYLIPIGIFVLIGNFVSKKMAKKMGGFGGNAMSFGKSNAKVYVAAQTGKKFSDVAGQDEAKEALMEMVDFLNNPKKYTEIGAQMPKGALLVGPPGTGKTLLAKAVAGEAGVPFFSISGSEFVEMFVGMGSARVRDLFKQAREKAPCIVFIDEIDTIGKKRDTAMGNDEREQTLNQLLTEMDGFDGSKGVVILAATNRPESLDKALLRPGRFDRRIPVELPDLAGREAILKVHARDVKVNPNIDFVSIAKATPGASGAELANIINEAALLAVKAGRHQVEQGDLDEAVETILAGYQRKGKVLSEKERLIVSYHEIGHALVAACCKNAAPVHKITIVPRTSGALGYTMQVSENDSNLLSKEEALDRIAIYTGGRAAEQLIFNSITSGASNDIEQATKLARMMITRLGMSDTFGMTALETVNSQYLGGDASLACSADTAKMIDDEVVQIIKKQYERAETILSENQMKLHELARFLYEKETITGEVFMKIFSN